MSNNPSIAGINSLIEKIEDALAPGSEIGARDKATLKSLLLASGDKRQPKFFPCRREDSGTILNHFVREKGIPQSKFSTKAQPYIFLL